MTPVLAANSARAYANGYAAAQSGQPPYNPWTTHGRTRRGPAIRACHAAWGAGYLAGQAESSEGVAA